MLMSEPVTPLYEIPEPDVSHLVTEDDTPVDNFFQDKQQDLLSETLRVSWEEGRPFLCATDVGIFNEVKEAIVPDVLLSTGVEAPPNFREKNKRSYFVWVFGKPPDVVIEIVSNRSGGEDTHKLERYAFMRVPYYVIYDPDHLLGQRELRIYQLTGASYVDKVDRFFPEIGLGLAIWKGEFDGLEELWLRWTNREGQLLETGLERSLRERERADSERERAEAEQRKREELERKLRELGWSPDDPA
ncbi:MAG: hypothetical protein AMXMBFR33_15560 [Candidatus Xenobia bacterium]